MNNLTEQPLGEQLEVLGNTMYAYTQGLPDFVSQALVRLLQEAGIPYTEEPTWAPVADINRYFDKVMDQYGPHTLFDMGKSGAALLPLPPEVTNLDEMLTVMLPLHQEIHRNGYSGGYRIAKHHTAKREYIVQAYVDYPRPLVRGFLVGYGRQYGTMVRVTDLLDHPEASSDPRDMWFKISYH